MFELLKFQTKSLALHLSAATVILTLLISLYEICLLEDFFVQHFRLLNIDDH